MSRLVTAVFALVALGTPALAFERMQRNDCIKAIAAVHEIIPDGSDARRLRDAGDAQVVTGDGWCRMRSTGDDGFETFDWRAEGIKDWINGQIPPLALEVRVDGIDANVGVGSPARPPLHFEATLRQVPDAGMVMVERAELSNGRGDVLAGSLVLERMYLSSLSMLQVSLGSVSFKAGLIQMDMTGQIENPFGFQFTADVQGSPTGQRDTMFDLLSRMPDGVVSDASRAELMEYAGELPKPEGSLEVTVNSARGLGLMQVGVALYRMTLFPTDGTGDSDDGHDLLFDGLTIEANWTPLGGQTD